MFIAAILKDYGAYTIKIYNSLSDTFWRENAKKKAAEDGLDAILFQNAEDLMADGLALEGLASSSTLKDMGKKAARD